VRTEDDVMIVPVLDEVSVVQKQLVLEELHIRRQVESGAVEVPVTLCKQWAMVERIGPDETKTQEETD
jgi:stress response protein YsnF